MNEEYFPRGNTKKNKKEKISKTPGEKKKDDASETKPKRFIKLFSQYEDVEKKETDKRKRKDDDKTRKFEKKNDREKNVLDVKFVPSLYNDNFKEGMVTGAVIFQISEYELKVSLPSHKVASISIASISKIYTELLRKHAEGTKSEEDDDEIVNIPTLDQMFKVGQFVIVSITEAERDEKMDKFRISATLNPSNIMAGRIPEVGDICVCSVQSVEDHGYLMDIGSKTARGFLPRKNAQIVGQAIHVGSVILCVVTKKDGSAINLNADPVKVFEVKDEDVKVNLHNALPGSGFVAKVTSVMDNGLKVKIGKDVTAYLHKDFIPPELEIGRNIDVESELPVRIVHVVPTINTVLVTAKPIYPYVDVFTDLKVGSVFTDCSITDVNVRNLNILLPNGLPGYVSPKQAHKKSSETVALKEKFKVGGKVKARVIGVDYMTGQAICSLQTDQMDKGLTRVEDFKLGEKVEAVVDKFNEKGLEVTVDSVHAFIPFIYLSDVPLKHPERKFLKGDKIKCKVMMVQPAKRRLHLTSKPFLVKTDFIPVSTLEEAKVGLITEGVVSKISRHGLLINLMGEQRGWVPAHHMSSEPIDFPEKVFWPGQSVKCQIKSVDEEKRNLTLSLNINKNETDRTAKNFEMAEKLTLGKLYSVKVISVSEKGVDVEADADSTDEKVVGYIPVCHLTDNMALVQTLLHSYKEGDEMEALYFAKQFKPVFTLKLAIITAVKSGEFAHTWDTVTEGSVLPGVVRAVGKSGLQMSVPIWSSVRVWVPIKHVADFYIENLSDVVQEGQTLLVKIIGKEEEKQQLVATTNIKKISSHHDRDDGSTDVQLMESLLQNFDQLRSHSKDSLSRVKVGDKFTAKVKEVTEIGTTMEIKKGKIVALCPASSSAAQNLPALAPGDKVGVRVLFVDYQARVVEVQRIEDTTATTSQNNLKIGDIVKGDIILTRSSLNLLLVSVTHPKEFEGTLVTVPDILHLNDLLQEIDLTNDDGQIEVVIKAITSRNEYIGIDKQAKKLGHEEKKRRRTFTQFNDQDNEDGVPAKKSRLDSDTKDKANLPDIVTDSKALLEIFGGVEPDIKDEPLEILEEGKKVKKKKSKVIIDDEIKMEVDNTDFSINSTPSIADPGWNFLASGLAIPKQEKASIWDDESEGEEEIAEKKEKKKKISKKEARRLRKEEEIAAEAEETKIILGENVAPQTAQEFEKLAASSPDSSLVWIQFMAFHLQSCQYDEARTVARQAVERINYREENERLNVYLAWLNLENSFGTQDSLDKVLQEAVQRNDDYKVYSQMADIYNKSQKVEQAENTFRMLAKKFNRVKEVWIRYGLFHYTNGKPDQGRFMLTRALQNLEAKEAADISAKFAQIEFKYGDAERGKTMYEKLVASYPKRIDIWSSYADQLIRIGDVAATRALYTRISTLGLQAKKMKPLFAKWLDFETTYGTEEQQGVVRSTALQYINSRTTTAVIKEETEA